jgi:hypothetical protein
MAARWVDTTSYFGPDRRRRGGRRLLERRSLDEAGELPPLGHMLRRLRILITNARTPEENERTMQLLMAALREAERLNYHRCADALKQADRILRMGGRGAGADADSRVVEALDHAHFQR